MPDIDYEKEPRVLELADLCDILADIVSRLERIENATKPRAEIDEGYKGIVDRYPSGDDDNGRSGV